MKNKKNLIKQIIYRSSHRGTKEMDILLSGFVKKIINKLNDIELLKLDELLNYEDEILYKCYFEKENNELFSMNEIAKMLQMYKI